MDEKEARRLFDESFAWAQSIAGDYAKNSIRHVESNDVKQEAGIALWRAAETFDPSRNIPFRFYAKRCITNRLDSLYRAGQKQAHEETSLDAAAFFEDVNDDTFKDQIPSPDVDAAREAHRAEVRRALAEGMGKLTPNQRDILEARSPRRRMRLCFLLTCSPCSLRTRCTRLALILLPARRSTAVTRR